MTNYYNKYSKFTDSNNKREELKGYSTDYENFALSYLTLRKIIGFLGILLPIICLSGSLIHEYKILPSISHYYHSSTRIFFTTTLFLLAIFLWTYNVDDKFERAICKTLSIMAALIVFFPTSNNICTIKSCYTENDLRLFIMPAIIGQPWEGEIHLFCALIFFGLLIYLIFYKFLAHERIKDLPDVNAMKIYKLCGWGMVISILGIGCTMLIPFFEGCDNWTIPPTFACETVALICFGLSWLTKGETFRH